MSTLLIVDDDADIIFTAKMALKKYVSNILTETNPQKIESILYEHDINIVLLDMNFTKDTTSGNEGLNWLKAIKKIRPDITVVLTTAYADVNLAVKGLKEGASDFILKPWVNEKLVATIKAGIDLNLSKQKILQLEERNQAMKSEIQTKFDLIIGESPEIKELFKVLEKVSQSEANILITGENGTGKELVARAIHNRSARSEQVFMAIDMGSLSDSLFESELFGYKKGAFTGALEDKKGRFEIANHGSIFLDEIGNISLDKQIKLLSVLQNREVFPLGSNHPIKIDVRVISATNMPLEKMVNELTFRQDLLYRLNTVELQIPALRNRKEDILLIAQHYLKIYSLKYRKENLRLDKYSEAILQNYSWPGNIRELQHSIERAVILSDSENFDLSHLLTNKKSELTNQKNIIALKNENSDTLNLEKNEKQNIVKALDKFMGNVSKAAKELGVTRQALYRRMEKYEL